MLDGRIPVCLQLVVNTYDGKYHLFEMEYNEMYVLRVGMLLLDIPGVPNVAGPQEGYDNVIMRLAWCGQRKTHLVQIGALRLATMNLEEAKIELPEWLYIRQLDNVVDDNPNDLLNG